MFFACELTGRCPSGSAEKLAGAVAGAQMNFRGRKESYPNLTLKRIPASVLHRCEWGKDDDSLKVDAKPGQQSLFGEETVG